MKSKSKELNFLLEKLLNPDDKYNKIHKTDKNLTGYLDDRRSVIKTHDILKNEAEQHLHPRDFISPKGKAVDSYKDAGYKNMNHLLRYGTLKESDPDYGDLETTKSHIRNLKALTKNPTQHEFYVYRGINEENLNKSVINKNNLLHDKGFTSTSLRPQTASDFGSNYGTNQSSHRKLFRIHIKPGTKGHYISGHRPEPDNDPVEAEFVLHPGTKFRVGDTKTDLRGHTFTDLYIHSQK